MNGERNRAMAQVGQVTQLKAASVAFCTPAYDDRDFRRF